jgi:NHLM bacteriocin system ABC transporter ATP-binding protein
MNQSSLLKDLFIEHGTRFELPINYRFFLHDNQNVLWIEKGNIDIFTLNPLKNQIEKLKSHFKQMTENLTLFLGDEIQGPLRFLKNADESEILFGFNLEFKVAKPLIIGIANVKTTMYRLSIEKLIELTKQYPELDSEIDTQIQNWVGSFSSLFHYHPTPKYILPFELEGSQEFSADVQLMYKKKGGIKEKIIWIHLDEGALEVSGIQSLTLKPSTIFYPLPISTWLQTTEITSFSASIKTNLMNNPSCLEGLNLYQAHLLDVLFFNKLLRERSEDNKIKAQVKSDNLSLDESIEELSTLFAKRESVSFDREINLINRACNVIGQKLNLKFIPLDKSEFHDYHSVDEHIYELCRHSHIQFRKVTLVENWWEKDLGPLLCFNTTEHKPIAVLPLTAGVFQCYLPEKDQFYNFSEQEFPEIDPSAYVFYRSLPNKEQITKKDLKEYLFKGTFQDWAALFFFSFLTTASLAMIPFLTRQLYGVAIANLDYVIFAQIGFAFILICLSVLVFSLTREYIVMRLQTYFDSEFSAALWQRILSLTANFFKKYSLGDLFLRTQVTFVIRRILTGQLIRQILTALFSFLYLIPMYYYQPKLTLTLLIIIFFVSIINVFILRKISSLNMQQLTLSGILNEKVYEIIFGISAIRTYGCENRFFSKWERVFFENKQVNWRISTLQSLITIGNAVLSPLTLTLIFFIIITQNITDIETGEAFKQVGGTALFLVGDFMGFYMAYMIFLQSVTDIFNACSQITLIKPVWARTNELLNAPPELSQYRFKAGILSGEIRIENLNFQYDETANLLLKNINIQVNPGEFIGIVGHSGSGKSTLIRLLIGFETATSGAIYYNGRDISTLDLQDLRSQMGIVLQNSSILDGTLRDNVVTGMVLPDEQIIHALFQAGFESDLKSLPMGLDTLLMNGGTTLSGGQKQRILIARALVSNPKILIFDEASSALDNETQEIINQNIERLKTTRIVIAHRLSTVRNADKIYVVDSGKIVQAGGFEELSLTEGVFSMLLKRQQLAVVGDKTPVLS